MMRLQIQLERSQHQFLKRHAHRLGISVSELIRRCVTAQMQEDPAAAAASRARRHDAALVEAFKR